MTSTQKNVLRVVTVLWIVWGLVHTLAGVMTIVGDAATAVSAIADAVPDDELMLDYHPAAGGVINQHGFNLLWFGLATIVGGVFIWRGNMTALWVTALIGGLADVGYFVFIDLAGFANFVPGTVMTLVSGSAILLSAFIWFTSRQKS